jgi:preprotein translocase subunit SecG
MWQSHWTAIVVCGVFAVAAVFLILLHHLLPGVSIAVFAVGAAVMSLRPTMHPLEKAAWMVIIGLLLFTEIHAIIQERQDAQVAQ